MACIMQIVPGHMSSEFSSEVLDMLEQLLLREQRMRRVNHCKNILSGSLNDSPKFNLEESEKSQNMNLASFHACETMLFNCDYLSPVFQHYSWSHLWHGRSNSCRVCSTQAALSLRWGKGCRSQGRGERSLRSNIIHMEMTFSNKAIQAMHEFGIQLSKNDIGLVFTQPLSIP